MRLPQNPFHPGKMTQAALAQKLGWTRARLNELIKGKRDITADSALDLARVLGTSAKLWMNLQATFDLDKAMRRRKIA
ncbi:MAG: HigA family addiction module antidote protein [Nitrospira sp.]|nr:HigA family addiction module antidote protein [Nitrospira sp.]